MNMSVCLSLWTAEEQRGFSRLLWAECVKCAEIQMCLWAQYGDSTLPCISVYEWIEIFKNDPTNLMDAKRSFHPSTSATDEKQEEGRAVIQAIRSECNSRRNCITTRCQWRYGIFFSAWHSCVPQGGCPNIWQKGISPTASTSATVRVITSWIASSLGMKPGFIITNQNPNGGVCNRGTSLLLSKNPSHIPLPVCSCWQCSGTSKGLS
jgi:hypothetical protein